MVSEYHRLVWEMTHSMVIRLQDTALLYRDERQFQVLLAAFVWLPHWFALAQSA